MKVQLVRPLLLTLAVAASGCADEDYRERVSALLADPDSARFQAVRESGHHVCGQVNHRKPPGGYSGYRRFVYDREAQRAAVDPAAAPAAAEASTQAPSCAKPFAYQSVEERLGCADAPVQQARSDRQREFEALWIRACAAES